MPKFMNTLSRNIIYNMYPNTSFTPSHTIRIHATFLTSLNTHQLSDSTDLENAVKQANHAHHLRLLTVITYK